MNEHARADNLERKPAAKVRRGREGKLADTFMVLVPCEDEAAQAALLEKLERAGYRCRALVS